MPAKSEAWPNGAPQVGQKASIKRTFTMEDIRRFDLISGDVNPLHHDAEIAAASPLGGICVQSGVSTSIFNRPLVEELPGPGSFFLNINWNYLAPVRPDVEMTGTLEVLEVRQDKPICKLRATISEPDGTIALDGTILSYTAPMQRDGE